MVKRLPPPFSDVTDWVFDLDNTLYPASTRLFDLIDERMSAYVQRLLGCDLVEAKRIQKGYFRDHGTTLAGLMTHHHVDPHHFLNDVHDIALDRVAPDQRLAEALRRLPGRRFVFTNGNGSYAERVLSAIGIGDDFHGLVDIQACGYLPKPDPSGYALLVERFGIDPTRAVLVEDMAKNLKPAKALGMTTVWVNNGSEHGNHLHDPAAIDLEITDVADWLTELLETTHVD
ncbi:MAG: pyrimidine 5'-nucleotidase [Sphingomicrobium sp.]